MAAVSGNRGEVSVRSRLSQIAEEALRKEGWKVERIARSGKSSLRRITRAEVVKTVSIRTSQDTWIAFPRTPTDDAWATLGEVDLVAAASVDDSANPRFAQVHLIPADEVRARFDRAYAARKMAGYTLPIGRGVWVSLYEREAHNPVKLVGAGAGLDYPAVLKIPLAEVDVYRSSEHDPAMSAAHTVEPPLTIAEAKRRLATALGVAESDIRITIST